MADRALVSMAKQFSGLPMNDLIGGPLMAATKANGAMAMTQTKFMLDTCFVSDPANAAGAHDNYTPIMITMELERPVIDTTAAATAAPNSGSTMTLSTAKTKFNLPLLTIIPLNSLAVESVDIGFEMEVKSSFAEDNTETKEKDFAAEASFSASFGVGPFSATISGSVSYSEKDSSTHSTHYQKSNSAKYTVNVHAGQLPLPQGVNTIINAFSNAIEPIEVK